MKNSDFFVKKKDKKITIKIHYYLNNQTEWQKKEINSNKQIK